MTIHPSPFHLKVLRSPVDTREEQTKSGLHVVQNVSSDDRRVLRGIVVEVGKDVTNDSDWADVTPGTVVFYLHAIRLGDHDFVLATFESIIAWEDGS
jgi:hypothetical protein